MVIDTNTWVGHWPFQPFDLSTPPELLSRLDAEGIDRSAAHWMSTLPTVRVASTLEFPYATAGGTMVTAGSAREFGRDLARAMAKFLTSLDESS